MLEEHVERLKERRTQIARERAALDEEDAGLARMIAAAEQRPMEVAPAPAPQVVPVPYPVPMPGVQPWPQPDPLVPWIVGPTCHGQHPSHYYCPRCSPIVCGTVTTTGIIDAEDFLRRHPGLSAVTTTTVCGTPLCGGSVRIGDPLGLPVDNGIRYTAHGGIS